MYNEESPALDLDAMFRLYLIGKIINLEITYSELIHPLEGQQASVLNLLTKETLRLSHYKKNNLEVNDEIINAYGKMFQDYKNGLTAMQTTVDNFKSIFFINFLI